MSRSAYEIAESALDDLHQTQDAFIELNAMFTMMLDHFQKDSMGHAFAELGAATVGSWSEKLRQCSDHISKDLDAVPAHAR